MGDGRVLFVVTELGFCPVVVTEPGLQGGASDSLLIELNVACDPHWGKTQYTQSWKGPWQTEPKRGYNNPRSILNTRQKVLLIRGTSGIKGTRGVRGKGAKKKGSVELTRLW